MSDESPQSPEGNAGPSHLTEKCTEDAGSQKSSNDSLYYEMATISACSSSSKINVAGSLNTIDLVTSDESTPPLTVTKVNPGKPKYTGRLVQSDSPITISSSSDDNTPSMVTSTPVKHGRRLLWFEESISPIDAESSLAAQDNPSCSGMSNSPIYISSESEMEPEVNENK